LNEKELEDFKNECLLMTNLRPHRNVVPLLGICTDPEKLCIITDYIENGSLERLIKSSIVITWDVIFNIVKGIQAGVYHLHQENILHRDLAARNILLRPNYQPLIADFGLSKKVPINLDPKERSQVKTTSDSFRGPYKWMAPESLQKGEFSIKSDTYSYGVVLYEIVARQEPFPLYSIQEAAKKVVYENLRLVPPPITPPKFSSLMNRCWERDPAYRPDFKEIGNLLAELELEIIRQH